MLKYDLVETHSEKQLDWHMLQATSSIEELMLWSIHIDSIPPWHESTCTRSIVTIKA